MKHVKPLTALASILGVGLIFGSTVYAQTGTHMGSMSEGSTQMPMTMGNMMMGGMMGQQIVMNDRCTAMMTGQRSVTTTESTGTHSGTATHQTTSSTTSSPWVLRAPFDR